MAFAAFFFLCYWIIRITCYLFVWFVGRKPSDRLRDIYSHVVEWSKFSFWTKFLLSDFREFSAGFIFIWLLFKVDINKTIVMAT